MSLLCTMPFSTGYVLLWELTFSRPTSKLWMNWSMQLVLPMQLSRHLTLLCLHFSKKSEQAMHNTRSTMLLSRSYRRDLTSCRLLRSKAKATTHAVKYASRTNFHAHVHHLHVVTHVSFNNAWSTTVKDHGRGLAMKPRTRATTSLLDNSATVAVNSTLGVAQLSMLHVCCAVR